MTTNVTTNETTTNDTTVDGILFDVDDTLVDTKGAFATALAAVRAEYLPHVPREREPEILAHWRTDPGGYYSRYTRGETDHVTQRRLRAALLHETYGGAPVTEASFVAWDALFWGTFEKSWTAHDDARAAVDAVIAAGIRVGVVTNAATTLQEHKLRMAGLADLPVLVGVDTLGFGKPDPRVFLEGARLLGTDPARTAYVGDEPTVDALAAHQARLTGVWLDRAGHRRGPGYGGSPAPDGGFRDVQDPDALRAAGVLVIETLAELPAALGYGAGQPRKSPEPDPDRYA
jgi:putative hydrolase of the HAD superfamily